MLTYDSDSFVGNGMFVYLISKRILMQTFQSEDVLHQSLLHQYQTIVSNIIDNEQACSDIAQFLNKNRFEPYNNVVVIVVDSSMTRSYVELLYAEKTIVLTEKSLLRDSGQLAELSVGGWSSRLYRPQKRLTEREQQTLNLLASGYTAEEIPELVSLNHKTIRAHRIRVVAKLGLINISDLNKLAVRFTRRMSFLPWPNHPFLM